MSESAFAFRSSLSLEDILARLQSQATERWRAVDSDRREDLYVTNTPTEDGQAKYRIFPERERYVIDIDYVLDDPVAFSHARDHVQREILPLLEAYDITPHPGWE
jgi:hypothetical protein